MYEGARIIRVHLHATICGHVRQSPTWPHRCVGIHGAPAITLRRSGIVDVVGFFMKICPGRFLLYVLGTISDGERVMDGADRMIWMSWCIAAAERADSEERSRQAACGAGATAPRPRRVHPTTAGASP